MSTRRSETTRMAFGLSLQAFLVGVAALLAVTCALACSFPCHVRSPAFFIDNSLLLWLAVLTIPVVSLVLGSYMQDHWRPRVSLLLLLVSVMGFLFLMTDLGILLVGKRLWVELAEHEENAQRRICYARAVVASTDYGGNALEEAVSRWVAPSRQALVFEAASAASESEQWKNRFQARADGADATSNE